MDTTVHWNQLIGFEKILAALSQLHRRNSVPQGILFVGREGMGKSKLALGAAGVFLCETQSSCGHCQYCLDIAMNRHPDVLSINPDGKSILYRDVQEISHHLSTYPTQSGGARVVIIVDAERLTERSLNSLLKTLEEPNPGQCIILTSSKHKLLRQTLLSRLIKWPVAPIPQQQLLEWAQRVPTLADQPNLKQAISHARGAPGAVLQFYQQDSRQLEAQECCQQLLSPPSDAAIIDSATTLARKLKIAPIELVSLVEQKLNLRYKQYIANSACQLNPIAISHRRKKLSDLRKLACKQQIVVNSQLAAESIGFCRDQT